MKISHFLILGLTLFLCSYGHSFDCPPLQDEILESRCLIFAKDKINVENSNNELCVKTIKRFSLKNPEESSCQVDTNEFYLAEVRVEGTVTDRWEFDVKTFGTTDPLPGQTSMAQREFYSTNNISPISGDFKISVTYSLLTPKKGSVTFGSSGNKRFFFSTNDNWGVSN